MILLDLQFEFFYLPCGCVVDSMTLVPPVALARKDQSRPARNKKKKKKKIVLIYDCAWCGALFFQSDLKKWFEAESRLVRLSPGSLLFEGAPRGTPDVHGDAAPHIPAAPPGPYLTADQLLLVVPTKLFEMVVQCGCGVPLVRELRAESERIVHLSALVNVEKLAN